ncbi:MAG: trans-aconitate 2-methyltransferase [Verrucomicrobiia bacterium]
MITRFLASASGVTPICFLGAGSGYEARELAAKVQLGTILCSDLAYTMLAVVPRTLDDVELRFGLFTSDLQNVPLRRSDSAVIIHEALHHTADMHETLRKLLAVGHARLILVEPVGNTLLRILAKFGLAQRVEYSGVRPGKLDLPRALRLASEHGYRATVWTGWEFPGDYYERFFTWVPMCAFLKAVDFLSRIGRPLQFGNFAVIHLWKD